MMIFWPDKKLLQQLDKMIDEAIAGTFHTETYDESLLSKIESKMLKFLEQSRLRQEQIEGERGHVRSLIGDISHQTKTPLANMALYTQLLAEQGLTDEQAKLADQIAISTDKLNFLIQALVKTSRLESGVIKIEPKPGDVQVLIAAAVADCESLAAAKGITIHVHHTSLLTAMYDERWCTEALFNILENAVKYTENGCVIVTTTEYEMFVGIDVTDTGRGICEDDLPKVFKRFWRAEESADKPGVGIGLFLACEIITACGGYLKVSSRLGKGSTISVFLTKV